MQGEKESLQHVEERVKRLERYGWKLGADGEHGGINQVANGSYVRLDEVLKVFTEARNG